MPLFTVPVPKQIQASTAGRRSYPEILYPGQDKILVDEFNRATLNSNSNYALYATAANGSGTATLDSGNLKLSTGSTATNDVSVRTTEMLVERTTNFIDNRVITTIDVIFNLEATDLTEGFIGLAADSALSALPTTAQHLGIYWDASEESNFILSQGTGAGQNTQDTGTALTTDKVRVQIVWNGTTTATMKLFTGSSFTTEATNNLSVSGNTISGPFALHFFEQTETAGARELLVQEWKAEFK